MELDIAVVKALLGGGGAAALLAAVRQWRRTHPTTPTVREYKNEESVTAAVQSLKRAVMEISNAVTSLMKINEIVMEQGVKIDALRRDSLRQSEDIMDVRREASGLEDRVQSLEQRKRS